MAGLRNPFVLKILLIRQKAFTIMLLPWRIRYANVFDLTLTLIIVVLLTVSAFFVNTSNLLQPMASLGAFIFGFLGLAMVPSVCWGIYMFWALRKRKSF